MDNANSLLSQHPIAKGLVEGGVSLIPFLGTAITGTLNTRAALLFERNTTLLTNELKTQVHRLSENKIDREFLDSDEFTFLILDVLAKNAYTYEEVKTQLFAQILINSTLKGTSSTPYKEGFVRIVSDLSAQHIQIFTAVFRKAQTFTGQHQINNEDYVKAQEIAGEAELTQSRTIAYCEELIRYGLLSDWSVGRWEYQRGLYSVTDYGAEFASFLMSHVSES
ncbi:hypothetical protein [Truepera radiovictrix]|uniref:hypothetical protein n=1 Tax=Truepera radiovictrix TaxID=332249 RepID=UPI0011D0C812|nr:hypothetical protein [Truepera radiovictrix]WMT57905.1 hypothetical protein RCV51_02895 [Truepera radiovictrix]